MYKHLRTDAQRFVASLLILVSLGEYNTDKRFAFGLPKLTSWASFIRNTLGDIEEKSK